MHPNITISWLGVFAAFVAAFAWGGLWYGPIAGRKWAAAMGYGPDFKPEPGAMKRAFAIQIATLLLTIWVLNYTGGVWRPSVWGIGPIQGLGSDASDFKYGFFNAFFTWLGFYVPLQAHKVAWEGRPWRLFFLNITHDFVSLQLICQALEHLR